MKIPYFLSNDDYLQMPILHRFIKEHSIKVEFNNKADYIKEIEKYSELSTDNKKETIKWIDTVAKEGSKEIFYKKINNLTSKDRNEKTIKMIMKNVFPDCPMTSIVQFKNTKTQTLINYNLILNKQKQVDKIELVFSQLFLCGEVYNLGDVTIYPIWIDIYLDKGFIVGRGKAKSTLFIYNEENRFLTSECRVSTEKTIIECMNNIIELFNYKTENNNIIVKQNNSRALYGIYNKYSFTPKEVEIKVLEQKDFVLQFVDDFFDNLNLDSRNKAKAILDTNILLEKFISINGNNEDVFKNDRDAYLVKVSSKDVNELSSIETMTAPEKPLQCTESFYDSKKSVMDSKACKMLHIVFKRNNPKYFSKSDPLIVQFMTKKDYGCIKTLHYGEEGDIQNVLQAIFENYKHS